MPALPRSRARVHAELTRARRTFYEETSQALEIAVRCQGLAHASADAGLRARAYMVQGLVCVHRGDLRGGLELAIEAERYAEAAGEEAIQSEVEALRAQVSLFTGSSVEALRLAELAVRHADSVGELSLRIFARRTVCPVFAAAGAAGLRERVEQLLELALASEDEWEEALARNDLGCYLQEQGELDHAAAELDRALAAARRTHGSNGFALAVIQSSRADLRLLLGRPQQALEDAEQSIELLTDAESPNPYVLGATVRAAVEAGIALGRLEDAKEFGERALNRLGDGVPQTRSLILSTLATSLGAAGRFEEAYDTLQRAVELERRSFRELSDLQLKLERAALEARAAQHASAALEQRNQDLTEAHSELQSRTIELETGQARLREQAERDWLTGLHNRRYLAHALETLEVSRSGPFSLAVVDLDRFKAINDRFGHQLGDEVLVRVATLLAGVARRSDNPVRSGGEEFIVLMPETDENAAAVCCERIRRAISDEPWELLAPGLGLTASVGLATGEAPRNYEDLDALVRLADERLYEAKRGGRDRVAGGVAGRATG